MTLTASAPTAGPPTRRGVDVEIVIPVYNEEAGLGLSVRRLHAYLVTRFPLSWVITIVDNASTDRTWKVASKLAGELFGVRALHLDRKGRGVALRAAWSTSTATAVAYMDVDLSTDLDALLPLVAPLISGHSDLAVGSRLAPGARVVRGAKRELISRFYNLILRTTLRSGFSDAQCGFKAVRTDVCRQLLPLIEDDGWFFDTELLAVAEHNGLRIHEVPVDWVDDPDSRVDVVTTAYEDLRGVGRLLVSFANGEGRMPGRGRPGDAGAGIGPSSADLSGADLSGAGPAGAGPAGADLSGAGEVIHFVSVGAGTTLMFAVLFCALFSPLGAVGADVVSLVLSAAVNLVANRRYTFQAAGDSNYYLRGLFLSALPLVATITGLGILVGLGVSGLAGALVTVTVINLGCTAIRFRVLRSPSHPDHPSHPDQTGSREA